jgi:serine/threonine protein kinase
LAAVAAPTESGEPSENRRPPPCLEAVATAFPQLEVLELIGQGGMGAVYRARQVKLDRVVALKLLAEPGARGGAFAERFDREARLLAKLNHPGIVSVHDYGEAGGFYYLLMEYVDGVNLRQAMRAGRFTPAQALALVPKICEALQFAHDEGILHRDIKPENILLDNRGRVKIADFGIAKLMGDQAKDAPLTGSGLAVGTPHYMAPEQLDHPQDVDQRADIYSLGVVFYEMLTGELPIGRFAPPSQKTPVDPRVDEVVLRALERERERRQHNIAEVKTGVEQITSTPASRPVPAAAEPPEQAVVEPKTSLCYVTTPEHLKTFRGRYFYIYQGNGQLRLDERSLSFVSGWQRVAIPLASIRSLTLGRYALTAKPVPLDYLEVTFLEGPGSRTLLFTPTHSGLLPVWETNKAVAEWATAVQEAVQAATGRTIELNRSVAVRGRFWSEVLETYGLTAALCSLPFLLMPVFLGHRAPTQWMDWLLGPLVATITLGSLLLIRWLIERRALRKGNLSDITALPAAYDKDDPILCRETNASPPAHGTSATSGGATVSSRKPASAELAGHRTEASNGPPSASAARGGLTSALPPPGPARLSWKAVASAVCSIPAWLMATALAANLFTLGTDNLPEHGFTLGFMTLLVLATGGFVGLAGLALGVQALREVRASGGQLHGARLAVTAVLGIPAGLLIKFLPPSLGRAAWELGWRPSAEAATVFRGILLAGILLLLVGAAWALRQWARHGLVGASRSAVPPTGQAEKFESP